ncbi:hypothetical protein BJI47_23200 [Rhodococcus sp. 1168]|nr:hypothetical protein BJI47_23200 [Rhodococcus sp. 1168]
MELSWWLARWWSVSHTDPPERVQSPRLCPELGGCIRYGVDTTAKLLLMSSGIRSRRLAHSIAASITTTDETTVESLREHLGEMSINTWRTRYDATSSELTDLLEFTRLRGRSLLKELLETNTITLELASTTGRTAMQSFELALRYDSSEPAPQSIGLYDRGTRISIVSTRDHSDIKAILDTGMDLEVGIDWNVTPATMIMSLSTS